MVIHHRLDQLRTSEGGADDFHADSLVGVYDFAFLFGERAGFQQDRVRDADLADVMQQSGGFQHVDLGGGHLSRRHKNAQIGHADAVLRGAGIAIGKRGKQGAYGVEGDCRAGARRIRQGGMGYYRFVNCRVAVGLIPAHGLITPVALGKIKRFVGLLQQFLRVACAQRGSRNSEACRYLKSFEFQFHHGVAEAFGRQIRVIDVHVRQQNAKFLAAIAANRVAIAHCFSQGGGYACKHVVSGGMSQFVVDRF